MLACINDGCLSLVKTAETMEDFAEEDLNPNINSDAASGEHPHSSSDLHVVQR